MKYPIPPLTFFKYTSYNGQNIYDVCRESGWGDLEICHVFTYSIVFKQQIYLGCVGGRGGGLVVCGPHNCMILNIKTCFDKKVTLLAMVQQPSSLLYICTFKMKSNLGTKICAIANFYSGKYYRGKKTKNVPRASTFGLWSFYRSVFKATTFEWSEEWSSYTGLTVFLVNSTPQYLHSFGKCIWNYYLVFRHLFFLRIIFLHKIMFII